MTGLLADTQTLAVHGCHVTGVATAYLEADSEQVFEAEAADAEQVDARIRAILEDMPVAAMSIAGLARAETVSVLAEILSDYPDLPLVLAPMLLAEEEEHEDDLLAAALTAQIAHGTPLEEAVYQAGHYARYALEAAYRPGMGACTPWRLPAPPEGESVPAD